MGRRGRAPPRVASPPMAVAHGQLAPPALVDLAVNVRADTPPAWLRERIDGVTEVESPLDPT